MSIEIEYERPCQKMYLKSFKIVLQNLSVIILYQCILKNIDSYLDKHAFFYAL